MKWARFPGWRIREALRESQAYKDEMERIHEVQRRLREENRR